MSASVGNLLSDPDFKVVTAIAKQIGLECHASQLDVVHFRVALMVWSQRGERANAAQLSADDLAYCQSNVRELGVRLDQLPQAADDQEWGLSQELKGHISKALNAGFAAFSASLLRRPLQALTTATPAPRSLPPNGTPEISAPLEESAITHKAVADYLAAEIVDDYRARRKSAGKPSLFLVENCFDTFEHPLAVSLAEALGFDTDLPLGDDDAKVGTRGCVLFWSQLESAIEKHSFYDVFDAVIRTLGAGGDVLIVCDRKELVEGKIADIALSVTMVPRFSPAKISDVCQRFYGVNVGDTAAALSWVRHVTPEDLLINWDARSDPLAHIREAVEHRLAKYRCDDARELDALYAFGEARDWAKDWSADVRALIAGGGAIGWNDVERGVLLAGRHGMGKTAFARSLAKAAGIHLVQCMMPPEDTDADEERRYLRRKWLEAKSISPAILLVESGHANVDALTFMFDEFDAAEPVFVLVTHLNRQVTPELLRAGRLERIFEIPLPTARILKEVYAPLLVAAGCNLTERELDELSKNSQGNVGTLARAEQVVRLAQRAARRKGKKIDLPELMKQVYETPGSTSRVLPAKTIEDTAFHEAGHAVMMLLSDRGLREITYLSVIPKEDYLGVTRNWFDDSNPEYTRQDLLQEVRIKLGGRAAEEIKNGKERISTGPSSDLESATVLATWMLTRVGFGERGSLVSWEPDLSRNNELRGEVDKLLSEQYDITLAILREHWLLVEQLVAAVVKKEEITGDEMREIFARYNTSR